MIRRPLLVAGCFASALFFACAGPRHPAASAEHAAAAIAATCPTSLIARLPEAPDSWLFARPREIYNHPTLGPIVARSFDDAGERALIRRAERTGFDVRTLDRAAIAWMPRGTVYIGAGPLDAARIAEMLWERLLAPRARASAAASTRMEGTLGHDTVSLLVMPACGMVAFAEGDASRAVDRLLTIRASAETPDPEEVLVWHARQLPASVVGEAGAALVRQVERLELRVSVAPNGLHGVLSLRGPLHPDAGDHVRGAAHALATSPLGELGGAAEWLDGDHVTIEQRPGGLDVTVNPPWRALAALADALHGEVGARSIQ